MATVLTKTTYIVYTHTGGGVRHHHSGMLSNVIDDFDGQASTDDVFPAFGFPSLDFNGKTVPFLFMSVHGAKDGNHHYTSSGSQSVWVGDSNINILVVYAPVGGGGNPNGGTGVWVDAFNVDTGDFSDDTNFVQIITPPDVIPNPLSPKTHIANFEGDVSTATAEIVRANNTIDSGVTLVEWVKSDSGGVVNNHDYGLAPSEGGILFAFYKTPVDLCAMERFDLEDFEANEGQNPNFPNKAGWIKYLRAKLLKCERRNRPRLPHRP